MTCTEGRAQVVVMAMLILLPRRLFISNVLAGSRHLSIRVPMGCVTLLVLINAILEGLIRFLQRYPSSITHVEIYYPQEVEFFADALRAGCCQGLQKLGLGAPGFSSHNDMPGNFLNGDLQKFADLLLMDDMKVFRRLVSLSLRATVWKENSLKDLGNALREGACPALQELTLESKGRNFAEFYPDGGPTLAERSETELGVFVANFAKRKLTDCVPLKSLTIRRSCGFADLPAFDELLLSPSCGRLGQTLTTINKWFKMEGGLHLKRLELISRVPNNGVVDPLEA